ncbi:MAG TPA: LuxR family transcriptional regulator [Casimicrobiaceae bacterium]|nr:LuxR family transcriptional regulator [Casimicrobiaceae bacterium]
MRFDVAFGPRYPQWAASIAAAATASDPAPHFAPLLAQVGFDALTWITLTPGASGVERLTSYWSTGSPEWAARYRDRGYVAFDPRVTTTATRVAPVVWDSDDIEDDWRVRRFLDDAARHGFRSGVAVSLHEADGNRVIIAFDSALPMSEARCAVVLAELGEFMLLAAALQERVLRPRSRATRIPVAEARCRLTERERDCLCMAAKGLTSSDIGDKLGIAERTVNFHIHNVLRKLEAQNRSEAVAKALARGVVDASAFSAQRIACEAWNFELITEPAGERGPEAARDAFR